MVIVRKHKHGLMLLTISRKLEHSSFVSDVARLPCGGPGESGFHGRDFQTIDLINKMFLSKDKGIE